MPDSEDGADKLSQELEKLRRKVKKLSRRRRRRRRDNSRSRHRRHERSDSHSTTRSRSPLENNYQVVQEDELEQVVVINDDEPNHAEEASSNYPDEDQRQVDPPEPIREDLLLALGEERPVEENYGPPINPTISSRWASILTQGHKDVSDIIKANKIPQNCPLLTAPALNPEVKIVINDRARDRDVVLQDNQQELGVALTCLGQAMTNLLTVQEIPGAIRMLSDAGRVLTNLHHKNTLTRKHLIAPLLDKNFLKLADDVPRDQFLFGDNLGEKIKTNKDVKRLLKGVFRQRPSMPKYTGTWDPAIVLDYISLLPSNINLKELSKKLATLLALATAHRVQTLASIKIKDIHLSADCVTINITDILKTSLRTRTNTTLRLPFFVKHTVCPAKTLSLYIDRTKEARGDIPYLLITSVKPYRKATSQSISRWIKELLADSGIDTPIYSSHSTRHAATSKAKALGISVDVIKKAAGWSERSMVFARHYDLPVTDLTSSLNFSNSVLG